MTPEIENEQLRTRLAEMAAEVERLQSVIDEANAQKSSFYLWQHKSGKFAHGFYECEEHAAGDWKSFSADGKAVPFYARPIPAQQCTHERIRETQTGDGVLFNGSHGHAGYVIEEQQSPAVAVPDGWVIKRANKGRTLVWPPGCTPIEIPETSDDFVTEYLGKLCDEILTAPSPSITEQDALEIAKSYFAFNKTKEFTENNFKCWIKAYGRDLLDKLNGDKNAR